MIDHGDLIALTTRLTEVIQAFYREREPDKRNVYAVANALAACCALTIRLSAPEMREWIVGAIDLNIDSSELEEYLREYGAGHGPA